MDPSHPLQRSFRSRVASGIGYHRRAAIAVAVLMLSAMLAVQAGPADAITCSGWNSFTTGSSSSKTAWNTATGHWQAVSASWSQLLSTAGGPCVDVNYKQTNQNDIGPDKVEARGMYYSSILSKWTHGTLGWELSPKNVEIEVITNLTPAGVSIYTGSNRTSTVTIVRT